LLHVRSFAVAAGTVTQCLIRSASGLRLQHAAPHLIALDRLEQRLEVALAEAVVAFALDELEEHRPEHRLREDLQQEARLAVLRAAVEQDPARLQLRLATSEKPSFSNTGSSTPRLGDANSTNSNPIRPIGLSNRSNMVALRNEKNGYQWHCAQAAPC